MDMPLPIIGLLPGLYALSCCAHVGIHNPDEWNPASAYLNCGALLALLGLLGSALSVTVTIAVIVAAALRAFDQ